MGAIDRPVQHRDRDGRIAPAKSEQDVLLKCCPRNACHIASLIPAADSSDTFKSFVVVEPARFITRLTRRAGSSFIALAASLLRNSNHLTFAFAMPCVCAVTRDQRENLVIAT
ncbi:hypothetical protein [Rhodopseudomonas sp. BAL398]|uniref:hypothetical protein n=1 Tax=Rhodopseudomonas sp. BAL398 TaxID=3034676 RepID=UPI0015694D76|nr:hypothetical protein [Rhodopseudomonas sp. BAL398]MDF3812936.1 hypothetical protein [Rhodopseudomonas sp. BAL398]WOK20872.1 hypothetical protein RBJ75_17810 [Rhodopseudomonas sp. BAL398]